MAARPFQAAFASAAAFASGAVLPIFTAALSSTASVTVVVAVVSLACLALLGALAARAGGASIAIGAGRVAFWGALAMAVTAAVGRLFGTAV
jgi:VIT1/CCC1 family predicted Fe2+/Mn2+ transporter